MTGSNGQLLRLSGLNFSTEILMDAESKALELAIVPDADSDPKEVQPPPKEYKKPTLQSPEKLDCFFMS